MGRIRTIKPEFFMHEGLQELEQATKRPVMLVFAGLLTQADREGRFKWQPNILKCFILPFLDFDMETVLNDLGAAGFIRKYEVSGRFYGDIPTFTDHQISNCRERVSTLPSIDSPDSQALQLHVTAMQLQATALQLHVTVTGKGKGKGKGKGILLAPSKLDADPTQAENSPLFESIPLIGDGKHPVSEADVERYAELYPAVNVRQEVRNMAGWCEANPRKRKTASGIKNFVTRWLSRAQDKGGSGFQQPDLQPAKPKRDPNADSNERRAELRANQLKRAAESPAFAAWLADHDAWEIKAPSMRMIERAQSEPQLGEYMRRLEPHKSALEPSLVQSGMVGRPKAQESQDGAFLPQHGVSQ